MILLNNKKKIEDMTYLFLTTYELRCSRSYL